MHRINWLAFPPFAMALLPAANAILALRDGEIRNFRWKFDRFKEPGRFWYSFGETCVFGLFFIAVGVAELLEVGVWVK